MVGDRLKKARLKRGLSQQKLGDLVNVSKVSICGYEKETRTPTLETFIDLIDILSLTPDYLLGRDFSMVAEDDDAYSIQLTKEDVLLMKELKNNKKLYSRLISEPIRTIELIDRKIN